MTLNESIVEDAALEWFGELGYSVGHRQYVAPGEPGFVWRSRAGGPFKRGQPMALLTCSRSQCNPPARYAAAKAPVQGTTRASIEPKGT